MTLKNFLDANNNTFSLATRAARDLRSQAPSVTEVVAESIDLLTGVEPGTVSKYRSILRLHIQGSMIGGIPVDRLDRRRAIEWFNGIERSAKTKKNIQAVLSAGLKHAMKRGLVAENVVEGIKAPRSSVGRREPVFLSDEQVDLIRSALDEHYRLLLDFLLGTGLRYSEAAALTPQSFRTTNSGRLVVDVRVAWKGNGATFTLGRPKTRKSERTVTIGHTLAERVQERLNTTKPGKYVFGTPDGEPIYNIYFHRRVWQPLLDELTNSGAEEKYGARLDCRPGPHDLRHTHASRLIAKNIPLPVIQARLGHESIETTVNVYGHLVETADQMAADALE
ncbi:site-specific integrase [Auritidibacter ignavus]|uniref:tyrosine-type recombinase/integrase n=1 Tax=Auritidibacter ignavus TaxID=678932 RepID=UPI002FE55605